MGRFRVARPERFELPTLWFEARCSIQLSYGRVTLNLHDAGSRHQNRVNLSGLADCARLIAGWH